MNTHAVVSVDVDIDVGRDNVDARTVIVPVGVSVGGNIDTRMDMDLRIGMDRAVTIAMPLSSFRFAGADGCQHECCNQTDGEPFADSFHRSELLHSFGRICSKPTAVDVDRGHVRR